MNALGEPVASRQDSRTDVSRLREIPYNYTSFSDRELVIRLLGAPLWALLEELRGERRTGRSADAVRSARRHLGRRAQSICRMTARQSEAPAAGRHSITAERDRSPARRTPLDAGRDAKVSQLLDAARAAVDRFSKWFRIRPHCANACSARWSLRAGQHHVRRTAARVAATDATDWRVGTRSSSASTPGRVRGIVAACIELGLTFRAAAARDTPAAQSRSTRARPSSMRASGSPASTN
jgi:hypothetical protein